jgi:hypothetical protein
MNSRAMLAVLLLAACGGDDAQTSIDAPHAGSADAAVDARPIDASIATRNVFVFEGGIPLGSGSSVDSLPPIGDASVCVDGQPNSCTISGPDGTLTLMFDDPLGVDFDFAYHAVATGHLSTTILNHGAVSASAFGMLDDARGSALLIAAGFTYPPVGSGVIRAVITNGSGLGLAGATVALVGGGHQPVYCDGSGTPTPALTATTSDGEVLFGDVAPGPFGLVVTAAGSTCTSGGLAFVGSGSAAVGGVVDAASLTDVVEVRCP